MQIMKKTYHELRERDLLVSRWLVYSWREINIRYYQLLSLEIHTSVSGRCWYKLWNAEIVWAHCPLFWTVLISSYVQHSTAQSLGTSRPEPCFTGMNNICWYGRAISTDWWWEIKMFVRDIFYHVLAYVVAGRHCMATPCAYENSLMFLFDFDQFGLKVIKFYLLACYIPMVWKFRFYPREGE